MKSQSQIVTLHTVASWRVADIQPDSKVEASIPALQRGLVWKPQQVELLWDSIFRGFPIGSLVACAHIEDQERDQAASGITHHLLDGQQRSHAIAMGFERPRFSNSADDEAKQATAILWLDLGSPPFAQGSTREFLFRLTKRAHPWGYRANDTCQPLSASARRHAVERDAAASAHPEPEDLRPYEADCPVPVGILMQAAHRARDEQDFIRLLREDLSQITRPWAGEALALICSDEWQHRLPALWAGLSRAHEAELVMLIAPKELLLPSRSELAEGNGETVSNISHLFQRLNTQGTNLSNEELAYSMIKASFPKVANTIEGISPLRLASSQLVANAVRALRTAPGSEVIHGFTNVTGLRNLGPEQKERIRDYLGSVEKLAADCEAIDRLILSDNGLPVFIYSPIIKGNDVFLMLLIWQQRQAAALAALQPYLPGLVTLIAWFGSWKTVRSLYKATHDELSLQTVQKGLQNALVMAELTPVHSPAEFRAQLANFSKNGDVPDLKNWHPWQQMVTRFPEKDHEVRRGKWWDFYNRIIGQRQIVLYAQRNYLKTQFREFDRDDTERWEQQNRPWDDDHILAHSCVYNRRNVPYQGFCRHWINNIGNFWACSFEANRAFGDKSLSEKRESSSTFLADAFISEDDFEGFNAHRDVVENEDKARAFATSTQNRMLRLYERWYIDAKIRELLSNGHQT